MPKPRKRPRPAEPKRTSSSLAAGVGSRLRAKRRTRQAATGRTVSEREALARHLHDLLNALWPAAARIELSLSEAGCPPKHRETLEELARCVREAMSIAAAASVLVGSPAKEHTKS